jgi:hypothetical protein
MGSGRPGSAMAPSPGYNGPMQTRLRTLLIVVTVAAFAAFGAWFGHEYGVVQERKAVMEWVKKRGGSVGQGRNEKPGGLSFIREFMGDKQVSLVDPNGDLTDDETKRIKAAFPRAFVFLYRSGIPLPH